MYGDARERVDAQELAMMRQAGTLIEDDRRRRPLYFDGRFLAARDLTREQNYFLTRQAELTKISGFGVVQGLEVTEADAFAIRISAGSGVTPAGEVLILPETRTVSLNDVTRIGQLDATFGLTTLPQMSARNLSGLFIVGLRPVEFTDNSIPSYPTSIQGERSVQDGDIVEAIAITLIAYAETTPGEDWNQRRAQVARQIFLTNASDGTPTEVLPLAMIALNRGVVEWVDQFMVRRELGAESSQILALGQPSKALRAAHFQQYQQHLKTVLAQRQQTQPGKGFAASEEFQILPPAGLFPKTAINERDFTQIYFPPEIDVELTFIPADEVAALVEESLLLPPLDLTANGELLASISVLVLIAVNRQKLQELKTTVTSISRPLVTAAPGFVAKRKPLEVLQGLTSLQTYTLAQRDSQDLIDTEWRNALQGETQLWYVRRRNLAYKSEIVGLSLPIGGDEFIAEREMNERLRNEGLESRVTNLQEIASSAARANTVSLLSSAKFALSKLLLRGAVTDLEAVKTEINPGEEQLDRLAVYKVAQCYGDPKLGEGILRLEAIDARLKDDDTIVGAILDSGAVPELDRLGRSVSQADLPALTTELANVAESQDTAAVASFIRQKLEAEGLS